MFAVNTLETLYFVPTLDRGNEVRINQSSSLVMNFFCVRLSSFQAHPAPVSVRLLPSCVRSARIEGESVRDGAICKDRPFHSRAMIFL